MRRRIIIGGAVLLVLAGGVGLPVAAHYRAKARLAAYRRLLRAAGEQLSVAALTPPPDPEAFKASFALLQTANSARMPWTNFPPMMSPVAPGKARVTCQQEILATAETTNIWPGIRREVSNNQDVLADLRAILQAPALGFDLDYRQGASLMLPHLARLKNVAQWLSAAAMLDLHDGQASNACENLVAVTRFAGRLKNEPIIISELVRLAITAIAAAGSWEALQSPGFTDEQLKALQATWEPMDFLGQAEAALAMERAQSEKTFAEARDSGNLVRAFFGTGSGASGLAELAELGKGVLENPQQGLRAIVHRYPGFWAWKWWQSYDDELASDEMTQAALEAVRRARREKMLGPAFDELERAAAKVRQAHPKAGLLLGYGIPDSTQRFLLRVQLMEIQRSLMVAAIALRRYQLRHGSYPAELGGLVPEFAGEVPRDPIDGRPLRYRLKSDGSFLLYSVGVDGVDDGGDPAPAADAPKQWLRGRDAVWPMPASAEEVKTAFEKPARK